MISRRERKGPGGAGVGERLENGKEGYSIYETYNQGKRVG